MIDHLTNDMHIYEQVCLNVRDIQELKLIRLPSTFHESKAKLRAIDPCLVDIRLSPSDEHERISNESPPSPIARRSRGESLGSNGDGALISSSSNESTSSLGYRPDEKFTNESFEESLDKQMNRFTRLSTTNANTSKPVTLLAKKVLPKKIERNHFRPLFPQNNFHSTQINPSNTLKKPTLDTRRKISPIRVTITSKLNPNATPFYAQPRPILTTPNSSFTFYERNRFQPRFQPVIVPDRSQSINSSLHQQPNPPRPHQRFIPPRQMAIKKNFHIQQPTTPNRQIYSSSFSDKRYYPTVQQTKQKTSSSHEQIPGDFFVPSLSLVFSYVDPFYSFRINASNIIDNNGTNILNTTHARTSVCSSQETSTSITCYSLFNWKFTLSKSKFRRL